MTKQNNKINGLIIDDDRKSPDFMFKALEEKNSEFSLQEMAVWNIIRLSVLKYILYTKYDGLIKVKIFQNKLCNQSN